MNIPGAVFRFRLSRCALLLLLVCTAARTQQAGTSATSEEDVRRIVERAMAAVALAEAQATRSVAEMQIKLIQKDSELESLRTGLQKSNASGAEQIRAQAQQALRQERTLLAQVEEKAMEADSAERRAGQLADRVALLELELDRATKWLAEAREALDRYDGMQESWSDSIARLSAMLSQARAEKAELQERMESYQSRASMLEASLESADLTASSARDRAWSETAAVQERRIASLEEELETGKDRMMSLSVQMEARDKLLAESAAMNAGDPAVLAGARAEADGLRMENAKLQDKVTALQSRARVIEDAMKSEREKIADEAAVLRIREQLLQESTTSAAGEMAQLRGEIDRLRDRGAALDNRARVLDESLRAEAMRATTLDSELSALRRVLEKDRAEAGALARTIETWKNETERGAEELRVTRQERDALAASVDHARMERDSAISELSANRVEMAESIRALEESAAALKSLRSERDAAIALASARISAPAETRPDPRFEEAMRRIGEYEKELAALRIVLLQGAGITVENVPPPPDVPPVPVPPTPVAPVTAVPEPAPVSPRVVPAGSFMQMLNTAPPEELAAIPEIGPTRARAILWYRENVGPLSTEEDLKSVPGFNDERIRILRSWWGPKEEPR